MKTIPMSKLPLGRGATVYGLICDGGLKRRFFDIGLFPNASVKRVSKSPLGDPSCYIINGVLIAIRDRDAEKIKVMLEI